MTTSCFDVLTTSNTRHSTDTVFGCRNEINVVTMLCFDVLTMSMTCYTDIGFGCRHDFNIMMTLRLDVLTMSKTLYWLYIWLSTWKQHRDAVVFRRHHNIDDMMSYWHWLWLSTWFQRHDDVVFSTSLQRRWPDIVKTSDVVVDVIAMLLRHRGLTFSQSRRRNVITMLFLDGQHNFYVVMISSFWHPYNINDPTL